MKGKIADGEARDRLIIWIAVVWKSLASRRKRSPTQSSTTSITRRSTAMREATNGTAWGIRRIGCARLRTLVSIRTFSASRRRLSSKAGDEIERINPRQLGLFA